MAITGTTLGSKIKKEDVGGKATLGKGRVEGGGVGKVEGGMFEGMRVFLELGVVPLAKKKEILASIESNGGAIDFVISKKTTHVVTTPELLNTYKLKSATTHGCFVVTEQFLSDSVAAGRRVDEWPYLFIGDTPASQIGASSASYVGSFISQAFTQVSAVMDKAYEPIVTDAVFQASLNVASLCVGLGANVPDGYFRLNTVVNNMYIHLYRKPKNRVPSYVQTAPAPLPTMPTSAPQPAPKSSLSSPFSSSSSKPTIPTPLFREISPKPPTSSTTTTSFSSTFRSSFSSSPRPSLSSPLSAARPYSTTTTTSRPFSFSSTPSSPSPSTASSAIPPASSSSRFSIPPATKKVSYSFSQYEEERKKKQEEEKAKRAEESGSVLRERETRRKAEEEARKREMEEKRQELLEKRRQEDEERKQKNRELSEAREKRIAEERRKREAVLEKLKQKPAHDLLLTTSFFQQWDAEENAKRTEEEWKAYMKEMEEEQRKEEEKERAAQEKIEKREAEKQRKQEVLQANAERAAAEKLVLKAQRKEEYERNRDAEKIRKKKEWEERQAKLLAEYEERQRRRELKALKGSLPKVEPIDYDNRKIFIGGIKIDDITKSRGMDPKMVLKIRDERINYVLRMFDQFGHIHKRKVSITDKGVHCFVTFEEEGSVEKAMAIMKEADERKKLVEEVKTKVQEEKMHPLNVPHPNFYVRIPKAKEKKDKLKEKKKKKQKEEPKPAEPRDDDGGGWTVIENGAASAQPASPQPAAAATAARVASPLGRPKRVINAMVAESEYGEKLGNEEALLRLSRPSATYLASSRRIFALRKGGEGRAEERAAASDTSSEPDFASTTAYDVLDVEEEMD